MTLLNIGLSVLACVFVIPLWVVSIELLITLLAKNTKGRDYNQREQPFTILMPAHNEALIIRQTLKKLIEQSVPTADILVVADNCSDNTAEIARNIGVQTIERFHNEKKGKGYALDYGVAYLKKHGSHDSIIILDADCEVDYESLSIIAQRSVREHRPIQALYLMRIPVDPTIKQRIAGFAWLVKNKLRPFAMEKLGFPITLTGSGMAFPVDLLNQVALDHGNIVEDMQLGIDLSIMGYQPGFSSDAVVYSDFPAEADAERTQRTRWEHGHLLTIMNQVPKILKKALTTLSLSLMALAADIAVPPLALLVILTCIVTLCFLGLYWLGVVEQGFYIILSSFAVFVLTLLLTWFRYGRDYITVVNLLQIPVYILSKLGVYTGFFRQKQKDWVKTGRDNKGP